MLTKELESCLSLRLYKCLCTSVGGQCAVLSVF